jgi:aromatic-amino-acid transaminase
MNAAVSSRKFGNMPDNVLIVVAYTCSKGFTMYGQRMGAMICVTPSEGYCR